MKQLLFYSCFDNVTSLGMDDDFLNDILKAELSNTIKIVEDNRVKIENLAKVLIEKSRLSFEEMKKICIDED